MWGFGQGGPTSQRQLEALFEDLVGPIRAEVFWRRFRQTFITESDIAQMAGDGFDHVRVPINHRALGGDRPPEGYGWACLDDLVGWCKSHGLGVVLDLHGAPGGQTGTDIDDSPRGRPELFEDRANQVATVELWRKIASRYADEPWVIGYDLLNEPLPGQWRRHSDQLVRLYRELTAAIRAVDKNHLIIYEGTHWATDWGLFTEVWDDNSALQFHKYWSAPDRSSLAPYLAARDRLGLAIYMGEGGENSPGWLAIAMQLYEQLEIPWNFWPWKKLNTVTSPWSVAPPAGWSDILAYAAGQAARPDPEAAWATLSALAESMEIANCRPRLEIVNSLMRRAPLTFPAAAFTRAAGRVQEPAALLPEPVVPPATGGAFRSGEPVAVVWDRPTAADWALDDGRPPATETGYLVLLEPGEQVSYQIWWPDPGPWEVAIAAQGSPKLRLGGREVALMSAQRPDTATGVVAVDDAVGPGSGGRPVSLTVAASRGPVRLRSVRIARVAPSNGAAAGDRARPRQDP
jgi:hypothetical protein